LYSTTRRTGSLAADSSEPFGEDSLRSLAAAVLGGVAVFFACAAFELQNRKDRHSTSKARFMDHPCPERMTYVITEMPAAKSELHARRTK
jgi:hypothetical protein